jgi:23S rRNA (guanine745-N1)-methyltransferase
MSSILRCPVCLQPLGRSASGYRCPDGHSFDAARQGYVNLLLAHKKRSKQPGDSPEMIQSRRRFLNRGFHDRLSAGINQTVASLLSGQEPEGVVRILDAGCGEGFHLQSLKRFLSEQADAEKTFEYFGIDISKFAIRQATQRDRAITWSVASIMDLPFLSSSVDVILNVFAAASFDEFSRVLKRRGRLLLATPGPDHLKSLREAIYSVVRPHTQAAALEQSRGLFSLAGASRVSYQIELEEAEDIRDLLAMTPYFWNIDLETRSRIEALASLTLDIDVCLSVYEKETVAA